MTSKLPQVVRDALVALWTDRRSDKHAELYAQALQALESSATGAGRPTPQLRITQNVYGLLVEAKRERNAAEQREAVLRGYLRDAMAWIHPPEMVGDWGIWLAALSDGAEQPPAAERTPEWEPQEC